MEPYFGLEGENTYANKTIVTDHTFHYGAGESGEALVEILRRFFRCGFDASIFGGGAG